MEKQIEQLLKAYGMSVTGGRKKILKLFHQHKTALAHADIESALKDKFDRVTVYRTLQVFLEKGILHTVPTTDNSIRYALCKEECKEGHHHDNHIHFLCKKCGITSCLPETVIPPVQLPKGFLAEEYQMVVNGYCKECI
jgi:Fur family ferric uptake transcriptional regulator